MLHKTELSYKIKKKGKPHMKRLLICFILLEIALIITHTTYATQSIPAQNQYELINTQKDNLKISDFMQEAQKYTKESMPGLDLNNLLSTAISGGIDNVKLMKLFLSLFRKRSSKFSWNFK